MPIYFVTGNDFKFKVARNRLSKYGITLAREKLDLPEIQSTSLKKIVLDKAAKAFNKIAKPIVVMDAGLFIQKYNGFPGPYTSYIEKTLGINGLIDLIGKPTQAKIKQVVAYKDKNIEKVFESGQSGTLLTEKRGKQGYFFDYIFESSKTGKTLAEMKGKERDMAWGNRWEQLGKWLKDSF